MKDRLKSVLITDHVHPILINGLKANGFNIVFDPYYDPSHLLHDIRDIHGIIINSKIRMTREVLDKANNLAFIGRLGSGLEIIDVDYAESKGIAVFNSPEGNRNAVAEHVMGMLLSLSNKLLKADTEIRSGKWKREENRGFELEGKTLGIIGLGNTGQALARKLSGWALNIIYYDKYQLHKPDHLSYIQSVDLRVLIENSDIISLHLPLTEETTMMVNHEFIEKCRNGAIIINSSRGKIVDTLALIEALENGELGGACLDVFENEKPSTFTTSEHDMYGRLYALPNVVLSPHVAGWTRESLEKISRTILDKILSLRNQDVQMKT